MSDSNIDSSSKLTTPLSTSGNNGNGKGSSGSGEGVDRRIETSWWTRKRIAMIVGGVAFVALIAWGLSMTTGGQRLNVEQEKLTISTVERGPFQEYIPQTGNVLPRTTVYLDAPEGGRIEEVFAVEGSRVEEGEPLLRLSNNDLQLRLLSADAQRIEQVNRLQDMRFRMEQNALSLRQQLAEMNYNITRLEREHARNEELYEKQLISDQEYQQTADELAFYRRNKDLTLEGYRQDSLRMATQLDQMEASVQRMESNYEVLQQILDNLVVRAPVSGHLTAFDAEIGQIRSSGSRFGQIDVLDGYKVRAAIDEFYIARVARGQTATTQPIGGQEYRLEVTRVYPEVRDGRFEADLEFVDAVPDGIRRGQTIRFRLELGDPAEALLLPQGGFYQTTGGNWVYVLTPDGDEAVRRSIRIGRQNPQYFEVLSGLQPGDRVVTSSYDTFGDADRLVLK
ncbi:MAG: HlyD family efflux transporter periplasmic adaptor subunit [Bacteroidetes bacterium]|jgi:HlyD family secretion protein|nr:HlyD family efflux transporter periplasmic adaptor subunit [Bacteroidota bacterium]